MTPDTHDVLLFISGAATTPLIAALSMTLVFKNDCERQEWVGLASASTCSGSLTLPVHINNLKTKL